MGRHPTYFLFVILIGAAFSLATTYFQRKRRRDLLRERRGRSFEEFYADFYADTGITREALRYALGRIASFLCVDARKLLPADLLQEYEIVRQFPSDCDQVYTILGLAVRELGLDHPQINTLDDAIRILCQLYEARKRRNLKRCSLCCKG